MMKTPDTDFVTEADPTDMQDAGCSACGDAGRIWDAESGISSPCRSCAVLSARERPTLRIASVDPDQICAIVEPELESARAGGGTGQLSPIASLARLAARYLESERVFRRAQLREIATSHRGGSARGPEYDRLLSDVVRAEVALRRAVASSSGDPARDATASEVSHSDLIEVLGNMPGVDVATRHPLVTQWVIASESDPGPPSVGQERAAAWRRLGAWSRSAFARVRRGWQPR